MENSKKKTGSALDNVILSLEQVRKEIEGLKKVEEELKEVIVSSYREDLAALYKEKPEPFGDVRIDELLFNVPKKVKYDQKGLRMLHEEGAPVDVEYSVSETVYKKLNDAGKAAFMQFRTVEPGKISIKIERK